MDNLNPEFKKILASRFWKNEIWSFLPYRAESDLRAKSLNKVPFKASDCQNATNMWFSIEDLRKNLFYTISPLYIRKGEKPIFAIKHWFYSKDRFFAIPEAKRGNLIRPMAFFFLKSSMENHILAPLWQSDALNGTLFNDFAL